MAKGFYTENLRKIVDENFLKQIFHRRVPLWIFQEIQKIAIFSKAIDEKFFLGQFLN